MIYRTDTEYITEFIFTLAFKKKWVLNYAGRKVKLIDNKEIFPNLIFEITFSDIRTFLVYI